MISKYRNNTLYWHRDGASGGCQRRCDTVINTQKKNTFVSYIQTMVYDCVEYIHFIEWFAIEYFVFVFSLSYTRDKTLVFPIYLLKNLKRPCIIFVFKIWISNKSN